MTSTLFIEDQSWIVLFGGAARQHILPYMRENGISIRKVIIPKKRSSKLDKAVDYLSYHDFDLIESSKDNLAETLDLFTSFPLLSIGFPYVFPNQIFEKHPLALNLHPTLLPKYRGPSSGAYILINGEVKSGSTVHLIVKDVDQGPIILQREVALTPFDSLRSMQRKVYSIEPELVVDAIKSLQHGVSTTEQDQQSSSIYPFLRRPKDSEIDPKVPLDKLIDAIRACDPVEFPAFFNYHGEKVCIKIWRPNKPIDDSDMI